MPLLPIREYFGLLPVRVRRGLARGAWWSAYPYSSYWRRGGHDAVVDGALIRHAARSGAVCWDIGAHYGIYAVGLARAVGPSGAVEAFEPDPIAFRRLTWHRRLNRLENLRLHNVAVSDTSGVRQLYNYEAFGGTASHLPYPDETTEGVPSVRVAGIRLDDWLAAGRLRAPDFIKVDVEGHAGPVLRGAPTTVSRHRPVLLVAIHTLDERAQVEGLLGPHGYRMEALSGLKGEQEHFGEMLAHPTPS